MASDTSSTVPKSITELQRQLNESLQQLSLDRLQVLVDFAAYYEVLLHPHAQKFYANADLALAKN